MAFSLIANTVGAQGGSSTTPAINTTGANLIVIAVSMFGTPSTSGLSDSKTNTWTQLTTHSGTTASVRLFYCLAPIVGSGHTFTYNVGFPTICVQAWSGAAAASVFDVENGASGSGVTSIATGSITPGANNELVVTGISLADNTTGPALINGGFTISDQSLGRSGLTESGAMAYLIQTTATAANPTWSGFTTDGPGAAIASFKAAAGGGITGDVAWTEVQDSFAASGSVNIAGSVAWTEAQDAFAASGTVGSGITGNAAWTEAQDAFAAAGAVNVAGSAAWIEVQDSIAAQGTLGVFGSVAIQEIQDSWAISGTLSLPTITGSIAWTEVQDAFAAIGANGAIDGHDPGLRKRRKADEERRRKQFEEEPEERARRRAQVAEAFERVIDGKPEIHEAVADEIVALVEAQAPQAARLDFAQLLNSTAKVQALWDEYLERDDEEVLTLL